MEESLLLDVDGSPEFASAFVWDSSNSSPTLLGFDEFRMDKECAFALQNDVHFDEFYPQLPPFDSVDAGSFHGVDDECINRFLLENVPAMPIPQTPASTENLQTYCVALVFK